MLLYHTKPTIINSILSLNTQICKKLLLPQIICILLILFLSETFMQAQDTADVINFDQAKYGQVLNSGKKSYFYGEVEFSHKGVYFYADTVIKTDNFVRAIGNVLIQQGDTLNIFGDSLYYNGDTKQCEVYSRVAFLKGDQRLYTERLSYNTRTKIAKYSNGGVVTNGKTWVKSRSCDYNTSTEDAILTSNVYVSDPEFNIKSNKLKYNLHNRIVRFLGPTIIDQSNGSKLYCESGYAKSVADQMIYDGLNEVYQLDGNAKYLDSLRYVAGQHIKYYAALQYYDIQGDAVFQDKDIALNGERIKFDKKNNNVVTEGRSRLVNNDNILEAEFNQFDNNTGIGASKGDVIWHNKKDNSTIWAEEILTDRKAGSLKAYGKRAMVSLVDAQDTVYFSADTLLSFAISKMQIPDTTTNAQLSDKKNSLGVIATPGQHTSPKKQQVKVKVPSTKDDKKEQAKNDQVITADDFVIKGDTSPIVKPEPIIVPRQDTSQQSDRTDSTRIIKGYHDVKIFSKKFQGVGDSIYYSSTDSIFKLYNNPVLWSDTINQYKADTIYLVMRNKQLYRLDLLNKASILTTPESIYFNQITGNDISAHMLESKLNLITVDGTARTVFYNRNENKEYTGVNTLDCSNLKAWFVNNELDKIRFYRKNDGKYYPMQKVDHAAIQLKGFSWQIKRRPLRISDLRQENANVTFTTITKNNSEEVVRKNNQKSPGTKPVLKKNKKKR